LKFGTATTTPSEVARPIADSRQLDMVVVRVLFGSRNDLKIGREVCGWRRATVKGKVDSIEKTLTVRLVLGSAAVARSTATLTAQLKDVVSIQTRVLLS
jgi:hypothetical protein